MPKALFCQPPTRTQTHTPHSLPVPVGSSLNRRPPMSGSSLFRTCPEAGRSLSKRLKRAVLL
eukprot:11898519-Alexandrium_andersonii.AAC.1